MQPETNELRIKNAESEDVPAILSMMKDFAEFERLSQYATATEESYYDALFGENAFADALIAYDKDVPAGYALFFYCFSSFRGMRGIFMEDIYIKDEMRGRGVGKALLVQVARIAKERNCAYVEWEVLDWNEPAIKFYKRLGAGPMNGLTKYRLEDEAFENLAKC